MNIERTDMTIKDVLTSRFGNDSIPANVNETEKLQFVKHLTENGYRVIGSVSTRENISVQAMMHYTEGFARTEIVEGKVVIGPLYIDGQTVSGNRIGIWKNTQT